MEEGETDAFDPVQDVGALCASLLDDGTAQEGNNDKRTLEDGSSSKAIVSHEQIEQLQSIAEKSVQLEASESGEGLQAKGSLETQPRRRGRKPEEGHERSGISLGRSSLVPRKRKNLSPVKSPLQSEPGKEKSSSSLPPRMSDLNSSCPPVSLNQTDEGRSPQRMGRPKKKESMVGQDMSPDKATGSKEKPGRVSGRKKSAIKGYTEKTFGLSNAVVKKEQDVLRISEGEPILLGHTGMKDKATAEDHDAEGSVQRVSNN